MDMANDNKKFVEKNNVAIINIIPRYDLREVLNEEINGITVFGNITITDEKMKKALKQFHLLLKVKLKKIIFYI